ncbi:hypothetical protein, partial [Microcoleus sp. OTE_8_concoct_300]|uniref:hypothetical protein n=1 Tax=Microcoleus sp. OTE_8_concoct_300 TaxID=2964710 RepID=UPI00403F09C1
SGVIANAAEWSNPLEKINRTGKMPIPHQKITLVGWASCPSHQLMKRIFARGLLHSAAFAMTPDTEISVQTIALPPAKTDKKC